MMNKAKTLNYVLSLVLLILVIKLVYKEKPVTRIVINQAVSSAPKDTSATITINTTHQVRVWLTVAESKRLIAKGLKNYLPIKENLEKGYLLITKGTTNAYVAEELLNDSLRHGEYVLGHILPAKGSEKLDRSKERKEILFKDGEVLNTDYVIMLDSMNEGDIVLKGANIINYQKQQAGILIGNPTGGTMGVLYPKIRERNLRLIIPVGLEKDSSQDIAILNELSKIPHLAVDKDMPYVWSVDGELFTELEAIKQFANVETTHLASGGIRGAEGAVTICIRGSKAEVEKALAFVRSIQGEKPF